MSSAQQARRGRPARRAAALLLAGCLAASAGPAGSLAADGAEPRDQPPVATRDVVGEAGAPIPLQIAVAPRTDRAAPNTYLFGLPVGARIADAAHAVTVTQESAIVEVTEWSLPDIAVTLRPEQTGTFPLTVAVLSDAEDSLSLRILRSDFNLDARPAAEPPALRGVGAHVEVAQPPAIPPEARPAEARIAEADRAAPPAPGPSAAPAPAAAEPSPQALVERAERLIRTGDISGARLVLERAVARGEPRAVFLLAQTCDPKMLRAWKVQGLQPDPERAQALYARAARETLAAASR